MLVQTASMLCSAQNFCSLPLSVSYAAASLHVATCEDSDANLPAMFPVPMMPMAMVRVLSAVVVPFPLLNVESEDMGS